jgi:hypothetical protein
MMQAPIIEEESSQAASTTTKKPNGHQGEIWSEIEREISKSNGSGNGDVDATKPQHRFSNRVPTNVSDTEIATLDLELPKSAEEEGKQEIMF